MIVYKYMSHKAAISFIENPMLRVTPSWVLNDPFECKLSNSTCVKLNSIDGHTERSLAVENFMKLHGIVSLTETPDNLLMWSHYAEEHKGAVVEFVIDETDPFDLFILGGYRRFSDAKFSKVNYRKRRNYPFSVGADSFESIRDHYYLTKSDEWIYEREQRFILPINELSHVKKTDGEMTFTDLIHVEELANDWECSHKTGDMFFIPINSKKIGRIIIGYNAELEVYKEAMSKSDDPYRSYMHPLQDEFIGVEVARLHPERFELSFEPLKK